MTQVKEVMSSDPTCCTRDTSLQEVAQMMIDRDCGEIPVVDSISSKARRPVGVVTDRDIICRAVARGLNPLELKAADCMTEPCVTVTPQTSLDDCCKVLEENQIRRVPVIDDKGSCCGIVALADIARYAKARTAAEVVREVSEPRAAAQA